MRLRKSYIVEDQVLDAAGTVIKDFDFSDPIAALVVSVSGKKHDHANINSLIARGISKIEVVDGSNVIFSMNMEQAQALQLYATRRPPLNVITCNSFATNVSQAIIQFGRNMSDNQWALDPTRFTNLQLKVTYAFTEGAGYWKDNNQKLTIYAMIQEQPATRPEGFLMSKEFYSFTKATSGDKTIDLARDFPYRLLIWGIKDCTSPVWNELSKVKIDCDFGKFIPIEQTCEDLAWENAAYHGMLFQQTEVVGDGVDEDKNAYYPFSWNWGASIESWNLGADCKVKRPYSGYITVRGAGATRSSTVPADEALADGQRVIVTGRGYELNSTQHVRFGSLDDPEEFLRVEGFKSARLILTQGGGDALVSRVVSQQIRSY